MKLKESLVISKQKNGGANNEDRLEIAKLLIKQGYTVAIEKRKIGKTAEYVVVGYVREE